MYNWVQIVGDIRSYRYCSGTSLRAAFVLGLVAKELLLGVCFLSRFVMKSYTGGL